MSPLSTTAAYNRQRRWPPAPKPRRNSHQQPVMLYLLYSIILYALLSILVVIPPIATHQSSRNQLSVVSDLDPKAVTVSGQEESKNHRKYKAITTPSNFTEIQLRLKNYSPPECSDTHFDNNDNMVATNTATTRVHNLLDHVPRHGCSMEHAQSSDPRRFVQGRPYCRIENVILKHDRILSKRLGGESLEDSLGQDETDEDLVYQKGAFVIQEPLILPDSLSGNETSHSQLYYIQSVLDAVSVQQESSFCTQHLPGVTLLLQRYEYANFYHVLMDWWNAWVVATSSSLVGGIDRVRQVIWMDAHPASSLDDPWGTLFGDIDRMQWLPYYGANMTSDDGLQLPRPSHQPRRHNATCLESAVLVPSGYTSELYKLPTGNRFQSCVDSMQMEMFAQWILSRHGLEQVNKVPGRIVLIDRQPYQSHPRALLQPDDRVLDNLQAVGRRIQEELSHQEFPLLGGMDFTVHVVQFHCLSFREQLQVVRQAEVLIGNHGAGLTHLVFLDDDTHVLEFRSRRGGLFLQLADWKPFVHYQSLPTVRRHLSDEYLQEHLLPALQCIYNGTTTTATTSKRAANESIQTKTSES